MRKVGINIDFIPAFGIAVAYEKCLNHEFHLVLPAMVITLKISRKRRYRTRRKPIDGVTDL